MALHRRLARVHLERLSDGTGLIGQLLERELQLPRIDAVRSAPEQALTEHVQLMPQRRVLALGLGELILQGGDQGARRREVAHVGVRS